MPNGEDKIKLFESVAKSQGFSPEEVAPFLEMGRLRLREKEEEKIYKPEEDIPTQRKIAEEERAKKKEEEKTLQKDINAADAISFGAQNVIDILDRIDRGELAGEDARTALNFVAGQFAQSSFDIGGKVLTEMEQSLLQGTRPTIEIVKANLLQRALGKVPPQTGNVLDTNPELRQKMEMAINLSNQTKSKLQGLSVPEITRGLTPIPQEKGIVEKVGVGAFNLIVAPIIRGVKGYAELVGTSLGVAALPAVSAISPEAGVNLADILEPVVKNKYATPTQAAFTGALQTLGGVGAAFDIATLGTGSLVKQTLKIGGRNLLINAPLFATGGALKAMREGGDVDEAAWLGLTGQEFTGPFVGLFGENSVTQAADVAAAVIVPIVGGKMIEKFTTGQAMKPVNQKGITDNANKTFKGRLATGVEDVEGKAATSLVKLGAKDKKSVTNAENLIKDTVAITKSTSTRGISKELPELEKSARAYVVNRASQLDDTLGGVPKAEVVKRVTNELNKTSVAQASPKLFQQHLDEVANQLPVDKTGLVSFSKLDDVRVNMNSGISRNWFSNGTPVVSRTERLNYMKWLTSQIIKDIFIETKGAEDVGKAISIQHTAISAEPIFSNTALTRTPILRGGIGTSIVNMIGNVFDAILTPLKITGLRRGVPFISEGLQQTPSGQFTQQLPPLPGGGGGLPPLPVQAGLPERPSLIP